MDLPVFLTSSPQQTKEFLQWRMATLPYPHSPLGSFAVSLFRLKRNMDDHDYTDELFETSLDMLAFLCALPAEFDRRRLTETWRRFERTHNSEQASETLHRIVKDSIGDSSVERSMTARLSKLFTDVSIAHLCITELVQVSLVSQASGSGELRLNPITRRVMATIQSGSLASGKGEQVTAALVDAAHTIPCQSVMEKLVDEMI